FGFPGSERPHPSALPAEREQYRLFQEEIGRIASTIRGMEPVMVADVPNKRVAGLAPPALRVVIVARQPIVRAGLEGLLAQREEVQLVGVASRLAEAEARLT